MKWAVMMVQPGGDPRGLSQGDTPRAVGRS